MKKYLANAYFITIEEVEIQGETDANVWLPNENQAPKETILHYYAPTYEKAYEWLWEKYHNKLEQARSRAAKAENKLIQVEELKP